MEIREVQGSPTVYPVSHSVLAATPTWPWPSTRPRASVTVIAGEDRAGVLLCK